MLAKAREKAQQEDLAIHWIQADINRLPFDRETFDLVIGNIVLEFVENPEKVVAEALRVLKKDGRLVIGLINKESYWGRTAPKIWGSSSQKQKNTHLSHLRWLFMEI
jgi:ubiquinone/menaquinone biosynthesis C-methylase UbiE